MRALIVIPARFSSTRLPGKPLIDLHGKSMLHRVHSAVAPVLGSDHVLVATDDERIRSHCDQFDMRCVMTCADHPTGTDRVAEVATLIDAELYINVQGDEPLIDPRDVEKMLNASEAMPGHVLNAMCKIDREVDYRSENVPKVVARPDGRLLYMSRSPIPGNKDGGFRRARRQVCIYGFPPQALVDYSAVTGKTPLEHEEDIEILRFLELGYEVSMVEVSAASIAVDVPEDVERVEAAIAARESSF